MEKRSEQDGLVIFDDARQVAVKPVAIGALASLVTLVALSVSFTVTVIVVLMYVVIPGFGMLIGDLGPSR